MRSKRAKGENQRRCIGSDGREGRTTRGMDKELTSKSYLRPGGPVLRARKCARWKLIVNEDNEVPE